MTSWQWNFGDGSTSTQRNPSHTFGAGGTFTVTLSVTDDRGALGSATRNVTLSEPEDLPPNPAFTSACAGLACSFTDESLDPDGTVTAWHWDFGDGATSDERNASHTYAGNGTYLVGLTVRDNEGLEATLSKQVSAGDPPANIDPVANFGVSCTNLVCTFTDQSTDQDGTVTAWSWAFGDGATSTIAQSDSDVRIGGHPHGDPHSDRRPWRAGSALDAGDGDFATAPDFDHPHGDGQDRPDQALHHPQVDRSHRDERRLLAERGADQQHAQ